MKSEHPGTGLLGHKTLPHDLSPDPPCRPEFCNLFKEVDVGVEKEGEPRSKIIHVEAPLHGSFHVSDSVGQGECQLLNCRRTGFTDMIAADADRIPSGDLFGALFEC